MRILRWAVPIAVLAVAFGLRFWALDRPSTLVFDELYYVRDAISQLAYGFPTEWPGDSPDLSRDGAEAYTDEASYAVHPPLGKWLIGLGLLAFGPESGWGWRSAAALAGVATVAVTMRLGFLLSRSPVVGWLAGLILALDGVHITLSRVGLLDGFLTFFVALGALCVWRDHLAVCRPSVLSVRSDRIGGSVPNERSLPIAGTQAAARSSGIPIRWRRPWLLAAALVFGAAAAVKWSGLYPLAAFLIFIAVRDAIVRIREGSPRPLLHATLQAMLTAVITLPAAALTYLASWTGWIVTATGWGRAGGASWFSALLRYHADMLDWHGTLSAPHPFQSHPLSWPLALRPTAMYEERWGHSEGCPWESCLAGITPLPNPFITWAGVAALWALAWLVLRAARLPRVHAAAQSADPIIAAGTFVLVGYLSGWLPWVLTFSRSAVFQFYAVVLTPFSALALALVLGLICGIPIRRAGVAGANIGTDTDPDTLHGRRLAVACFLAVATVIAVLFFPVWSGMPVAEWFWRAHLWLPGWE